MVQVRLGVSLYQRRIWETLETTASPQLWDPTVLPSTHARRKFGGKRLTETSTSPSVYLIIPTVSAIDTCGNITGRVFTSVTFSFAPGELSTGGERGPNTAPFNFYDYPCPLPSEVWSPYVWQFGEPYRPQIVPPPQLFDLDPVFTSCFLYPGDCFDPPYALTPVSSLSPFTPSVSIASSASTPAPGPKPKSPGPAPTSVDVKGKPDITYTSATSAVSSPLTLVSTPASISSDVDDSKSAITTSSALEVPSSTTSSAGTPIDSSKDPDSTIRDNTAVSSLTIFPSDVQHPSSGDSIIKTSNSVTKTSNVVAPVILPTGAALTIDGEIITLQPTMFSIGSQMLSQGGPAITLSNTLLSLGSAGLVVGTTESILLGQALEFTIDDQTFTAVPSGLLADGETILPDQPGVTINDGNIIASLGPDDGDIIVVDGGSTTTIPVAQVTSIGLGGVIMSGFAPVGTPERTAVVTSSSTAANGTVIFSTGRSSKTIDTCALQWRRLSLVAIGLAWMYIYSE